MWRCNIGPIPTLAPSLLSVTTAYGKDLTGTGEWAPGCGFLIRALSRKMFGGLCVTLGRPLTINLRFIRSQVSVEILEDGGEVMRESVSRRDETNEE